MFKLLLVFYYIGAVTGEPQKEVPKDFPTYAACVSAGMKARADLSMPPVPLSGNTNEVIVKFTCL